MTESIAPSAPGDSSLTEAPPKSGWLGPGEAVFGLLLLLALGLLTYGCYLFWYYTVDDAFITLRFARNLADGYGFVYNPGGSVVEGFSNPLLLLFQAIVLKCGLSGIVWTKYLGIASGLGMLVCVAWMALDLLRWSVPDWERRRRVAPAAALGAGLLALSPTLPTICDMGLSGSLFGFLLTFGGWMTLRTIRDEGRWWAPILGGVALALSTWTRPEGLAWAVGYGGVAVGLALVDRRSAKRSLILAGIALGGWLLLLCLRLAIFHYPEPNTYYAKMGGNTWKRMLGGVGYVRSWLINGRGLSWWVAGLAAMGLASRSGRRVVAVLLLAAVGHLVVVVYLGGDWMPRFRFVGPGLGPIAALTGLALGLLVLRVFPSGRPGLTSFVSGGLAVALCAVFFWSSLGDIHHTFAEVQTRELGWVDGHRPLGEWLGKWNKQRGGDLRVAIEDIGLVGWYSRATILDLAGLADPYWAHLHYDKGDGVRYPTKRLLDEFRPDVVVLIATGRTPKGGYLFTWDISREILTYPEFLELYQKKVVFTHKDFPGDGYFLVVFVRKDEFDQAPYVVPPRSRASGS